MKLKSYFSATVEAAMELARKELGDDALLINARPATPETRYLGAYEVVFGLVAAEPAASAPVLASDDSFREELAELRRQLDRLTLSPIDNPAATPQVQAPSTSDELHPALHEKLAAGVRFEQLFRTGANLGRRVALVGPPGAGKTTTLVKLAARYGIARRRSTQILTADVNRIAAADQLRTLAVILGIPCEVTDTPLTLGQQLEAHSAKDLVLIDTPGFGFREMDDASELAVFLATQPEIDTHLVLSASMKPSDMSRVLDSYAVFRPSNLIFTHVDETDRYGALVSEASRRDLPISFLCTGQRIPDDLEEATARRLTDLVLGGDFELKPLLRRGATA
jgi:flagellar biosynthesis protein FlhF